MSDHAQVPTMIGNWYLEERLGSGYSGSIWRAVNPYTGQVAALKIQDVDHECPTNRYERYFYPSLQGGIGMPRLWASGVEGDFDYLVIDLLGASLDSLYRQNGRLMDLRSTLCIAMQIISRLEFMHSRGILHRDIQLGNCVIGLPPHEKVIYMIDFGFSKRYIDPETRKHIPDSRAKRDFIGNYWFSSVNVHCRGKVPSRRDDMEALALMLVHLLTPNGLPWTRNGIPRDDSAQDRLIQEKLDARPDDLCRGLPSIFEDFLRYCRRLKFFDQPDYVYWRSAFAHVARQNGFVEADGSISDAFFWPPKPILKPAQGLAKKFTQHSREALDMERLLGDIAKLNLGPIAPLADQNQQYPINLEKPHTSKLNELPSDAIVISSDEDSAPTSTSRKQGRQLDRFTKATVLRRLACETRDSVTNEELAGILHRFIELFRVARSKVVTKEAFEFLVAIVCRLEDPSEVVVSNGQNCQSSDIPHAGTDQTRPTGRKGTTVKLLFRRISDPQLKPNRARLALLLIEFNDAVKSTSGKVLSKDGLNFLVELEAMLRQL